MPFGGVVIGVLVIALGVGVLKMRQLRILLVSQMYPGPDDPDLGVFVRQLELALRERGHEIDLAVLDRRAGGKRRFLELRRKVRAAARPDVVWAHFLVPSGLIAASVDAPLVVTAHGRDVRNVGAIPGIARAHAARRRAGRDGDRGLRLPPARARAEAAGGAREDGRDRLGRRPGAVRGRAAAGGEAERPAFVAVGSLTERKNVGAARRRVRDARPRQPDVRRRRAAPRRSSRDASACA